METLFPLRSRTRVENSPPPDQYYSHFYSSHAWNKIQTYKNKKAVPLSLKRGRNSPLLFSLRRIFAPQNISLSTFNFSVLCRENWWDLVNCEPKLYKGTARWANAKYHNFITQIKKATTLLSDCFVVSASPYFPKRLPTKYLRRCWA